MNIIKKIINLFFKNRLLTLFALFLVSILIFYSAVGQGQTRYTIFRTQNEGFKFYRGNLYASVFGNHPISDFDNYQDWWNTSTKNQLTTKYYVLLSELAKIILYPSNIYFIRGYRYDFSRNDSVIGHRYLGGRSWIEYMERFSGSDFPASLSFEIREEYGNAGIMGGFRKLEDLPIPPSSIKKIRLQMYVNDSGFCVVNFSPEKRDSRNLTGDFVRIFIFKDVAPTITDTEGNGNFPGAYYNEINYNKPRYWYYFSSDNARYWSLGGSPIPLDLNLEDITIPANTRELIIRKFSDGQYFNRNFDDEHSSDWYMIHVKLHQSRGQDIKLSDLFNNFKYAYMEGQARNGDHWGGVACKFIVYTNKYLQ